MSTLALNQLIRGTPAFLSRLSQSITDFFDGIGEARAMADLYSTLSRMTDAQLAERGLKREDIPQAVMAAFSHR
jgi:hypothetical protein